MKRLISYTSLLLAIVSIGLLIFNNQEIFSKRYVFSEIRYAKLFFGLGVLCIVCYYPLKRWKKVITKIMLVGFGISFILNLSVTFQIYEFKRIQKKLSIYRDLETCEEMENRFLIDLKNDEIKFFQFGIGYDEELEKSLKKYNIESFGMGCIIQWKMICYNNLVDDYIIRKYKDTLIN
ncbi:FEKKY domain-containing protein [Aquimarina rhabdastrellae]